MGCMRKEQKIVLFLGFTVVVGTASGFPTMGAVVAEEDHDGLVPELKPIEGGEHAADLGVDVGDAGKLVIHERVDAAVLAGAGADVLEDGAGRREQGAAA